MNPTTRVMTICLTFAALAGAQSVYQQDNLVSNMPGALIMDPNLRNAWGISFSATGAFWVSDTATGLSTVYSGDNGTPLMKSSLEVTIPSADGMSTGSPTGQVFNGSTTDFDLGNGPARFIFATLDGTISGWNTGSAAVLMVSNPGASYTGLAIGNDGQANYLYGANVAGGTVDVFDAGFNQVSLDGDFSDPDVPDGYMPYNIQNLNGELYVTYQNSNGPFQGGAVNVFDLDGHFSRHIAVDGPLNAPWGVALAPGTFGDFAGALLVGNFGMGNQISGFDPNTGDLIGQLSDASGNPISIPGLWGLIVGNGGSGGDPNVLYFAAGPNRQQDGLFGRISLVPSGRTK